jgi:DNA-binding HxlR family transcriptional regulator
LADPSALIPLFHRRWVVPVLAFMGGQDGGGTRFVVLRHELGVSRNALKDSLGHAIERAWVEPNPGYGHPLRPEYRLTERGRALAGACADLLVEADRLGVMETVLRKWSVPVLAATGGEVAGRRFGGIRRRLVEGETRVTDRALSMALADLIGDGLVERRVLGGAPPRAVYALTERSQALVRSVASLGGAA